MKLFQRLFRKEEKEQLVLPEPVTGDETELTLLDAYYVAEDEMKRHFARNDLIQYYYKHRDDQRCLLACERICLEDIALIDERDRIVRLRAEKRYQDAIHMRADRHLAMAQYQDAMSRGFNASLPAFDRLTMMYITRGSYEDALRYCNMAIRHYETHATTAELYLKRKERIMNRINQECSIVGRTTGAMN